MHEVPPFYGLIKYYNETQKKYSLYNLNNKRDLVSLK